jgi:hypothetical protein
MFHVLGDKLLVTIADESRPQIEVCPPVYAAAGLAISLCGVTSADESRRQIVVYLPVYVAGLTISPRGACTYYTCLAPGTVGVARSFHHTSRCSCVSIYILTRVTIC